MGPQLVNPIPSRGKFLVLEGLDGSGKTLQFSRLCAFLKETGRKYQQVDFPDYEGSFHGRLVGRYLSGEFGDIYQVNPYFSSWLYAGDRLESKPKLEEWLAEGRLLVANRYTGSNQAYHSVKLPREQRPAFISWLKQLEYETNRIPREDLVVYFHIPVATAQRLVDQKKPRSYTAEQRDIHERNTGYLEEVDGQYLKLCATEPNWVCLEVADPESGNIFNPDLIQAQLLKIIRDHQIL